MSSKRYDLIGSGYVSMDNLIKTKSRTEVGRTSIISNADNRRIYFGGCAANICCLLTVLGSRALPIMRVGGDWIDIGYRDFLERLGVPLDAVREMPDEKTSGSYIIEDDLGNHITLFYPGAMEGRFAEPVPDELFQRSAYGLMTVASEQDNRLFLEGCRKNGVPLILGMKLDADAFPRDFLEEALLYSEIIFTNEHESEDIVRTFSLDSITDLFRLGNAKIIVETMGKKGSRCFLDKMGGEAAFRVGTCPTETPIADFTGAGDAYIAGFLYGFFRKEDPRICCELGTVCSSFIIEKTGCVTNAPNADQLSVRHAAWKRNTHE